MNPLKVEKIIKSLSEIPISLFINSSQFIEQINSIPNTYLVSRGGDALNYYFDRQHIVPTHDFDFGLVTLYGDNPTLLLDQSSFDERIRIRDNIGILLANELNNFFNNNLVNTGIIIYSITYSNNPQSDRLGSIICEYSYKTWLQDYSRHTNAICDLYILGNVEDGVINKRNGRRVRNILHWDSKILPENDEPILDILHRIPDRYPIPYLQNRDMNELGHAMQVKEFLVFNKIETLVQDTTSNMYYIAPGDLFNDTLRMVYISMYNINIARNNNKLKKYIIKLSNLIEVFNTMNMCKYNCNRNPETHMLQCNTNQKGCYNDDIPDIDAYRSGFVDWIDNRYTKNITIHDIRFIPIKKLCEINKILWDYIPLDEVMDIDDNL